MWEEAVANLYRLLIIKPNSTVLDLGTGFSRNLELLLREAPDSSVIYSIDPSMEAIETASSRFRDYVDAGRLILRRAVAEELPFPDESFNYVTSAMTFHHIGDKEEALKEVGRVMKNDGLAIIVDWDEEGSKYSPHSSTHLAESLRELKELVLKLFRIRIEKHVGNLFYYVVFEKKK